jgi:hypothetical protein
LLDRGASLYPRGAAIVAAEPLYLAQQYSLPDELVDGLTLDDLTGGPATDEDIVSAALTYGGLGAYMGSIGGTGTVMGSVAREEYVWKQSETLLTYIGRIDAISLGYKTFWNGSDIVRQQISSRPSGSPDYTFTEGVDISDGNTTRTIREAYNAVRVSGYAVGDYADPRVFYIAESNDFQGGGNPDRVFPYSNPMIERRADSSPGLGMSCESMCNYFLGELNREVVKVSMRTPRDEQFLPAQVHLVQAAGGLADRLNVAEKLWVLRVDGSYAESGAVSQLVSYVGGGAS